MLQSNAWIGIHCKTLGFMQKRTIQLLGNEIVFWQTGIGQFSGADNGHIRATVAEIVRLCRMIAQTPTINFRRGATLFPWQRMTQFFGTPSKITVYPLGYVHATLIRFLPLLP